jgi:acyl-CoA thioesterase II
MGADLDELFAVDEIGDHRWRSRTTDPRGGRMFGGTMAAQLLASARAATTGPPQTSSLEMRFLAPADAGTGVDYEVDRIADGRSSAVRRVTVSQGGQAVAMGTVGFHTPRDGWVHGVRPSAVDADSLPKTGNPHKSRAITAEDFDIRYFDEVRDGIVMRQLWFRTIKPLPPVQEVHECVLLLVSDIYFFEPICLQHGFQGNDRSIRYSTTQHAVWFHAAPRADEWLLIESHSPAFRGGRGVVHGAIRTLDGVPVATVVQEAAIRVVDPAQR